MTVFRSHTRAKTSTPLFECVVDHALVRRSYSSMTRYRNLSTVWIIKYVTHFKTGNQHDH